MLDSLHLSQHATCRLGQASLGAQPWKGLDRNTPAHAADDVMHTLLLELNFRLHVHQQAQWNCGLWPGGPVASDAGGSPESRATPCHPCGRCETNHRRARGHDMPPPFCMTSPVPGVIGPCACDWFRGSRMPLSEKQSQVKLSTPNKSRRLSACVDVKKFSAAGEDILRSL